MESRTGIVAVLLAALGGCGSEGGESLFGDPSDSGAGGEMDGSGGSQKGGSAGSTSAGRSGSGTGGSAGSPAMGGQAGSGKGGAGKGGMAGAGGMAQGGTGENNGGAESGGASGAGTGGSSAGSDPTGGSGATSGRGGNAGSAGKGEADCDEIASEYQEVLENARVCDPDIDDVQCTEQVPSSLGCGCPIFVNPKNEEALARLTELQLAWAKGCPIAVCPAIACLLPTQGFCTSSGRGSGQCDVAIAAE